MARGPNWDSDEDGLLRIMFRLGKSDEEISAALKERSTSAVISRRVELKLYRKGHHVLKTGKRADNLPDIGELVTRQNQLLAEQNALLRDISSELVVLVDSSKAQLEIFRGLKNVKKPDSTEQSGS